VHRFSHEQKDAQPEILVVPKGCQPLYERNLWGGYNMLRMALLFVVIALIAALFGFGLIANMSFDIAKILFFVFLVLAVLSILAGAFRSPPV
jgi:uncharacterized membrane protein YtjA (UPF0391 family)